MFFALDYTSSIPRSLRLRMLARVLDVLESYKLFTIILFGENAYPIIEYSAEAQLPLDKQGILAHIAGIKDFHGRSDPSQVVKLVTELGDAQLEHPRLVIVWQPPRRGVQDFELILVSSLNNGLKPLLVVPTTSPPKWLMKNRIMSLLGGVIYLRQNMKIETLVSKSLEHVSEGLGYAI